MISKVNIEDREWEDNPDKLYAIHLTLCGRKRVEKVWGRKVNANLALLQGFNDTSIELIERVTI